MVSGLDNVHITYIYYVNILDKVCNYFMKYFDVYHY